jgi:hypothetical protein
MPTMASVNKLSWKSFPLGFLFFRGFDTYSGLYVGDDTEEKEDGGGDGSREARRRASSRRDSATGHSRKPPRREPSATRPEQRDKRWQRQEAKRGRKNRRKTKSPAAGPEDKFESVLYASKAAEIIRSQEAGRPFFIYLSFLTKSYPRDNKVRRTHNR